MWGVKTHPSMSVDLSQWQHHQNASLSQPAALAQARGFVEPSGPQAARPWSEELSRLSDFHQFHISQHNLSLCNSQSLIACLSLTPYYSLSLTNSGEVWKSCCQKECLLCEWKGHFFSASSPEQPALHAFLPLYHVNLWLLRDWHVLTIWPSDFCDLVTSPHWQHGGGHWVVRKIWPRWTSLSNWPIRLWPQHLLQGLHAFLLYKHHDQLTAVYCLHRDLSSKTAS